jgi:serine/threonine protein kinase
MKTCDTCGGSIGSDHPFAVCPKCLFQDALAAASPQAGVGRQRRQAGRGIGIPVRDDFFDKYEVLERLDEGGQGEVYRAWDYDLRRLVAMKRLAVPFLESEAAVYRFFAEAQIASQLEHPGVLPIHDVGLDPDGLPFFTTPVLPGTTLADVFGWVRDPNRSDWTVDRALDLLVRVCEIVAYGHSRGVIHRDLKPSNLLVGQFGDVRVIDWGSAHVLREARAAFEEAFVRVGAPVVETDRDRAIARALDSPLSTFHAGQPVTLLFSPPEILRGQLEYLGPQTDVYSLGVMLYELVAGRPPYADDAGALPRADRLRELILAGPPPRLTAIKPKISRDLAAICEKATAREVPARYLSMPTVAGDLRAFLEVRPVEARRSAPLIRLRKWARRNSSYVAFGSLAIALVATSASAAWRLKIQKDQARQVTALRAASLAARSGQWRQVLDQLAAADAAGFPDKIDLALQRMEAWECLGKTDLARAGLSDLMKRSDLGQYRGRVLLAAGEFELFAKATAAQGIEHVRAALASGLDPAHSAYAQGLIANTTPEALNQFRATLSLDPYHRGAHRLSLGFEFILGHQPELDSHLRVFKVLFPDDPSPVAIEATQMALAGRFEDAERLMTNRADVAGMQGARLALEGFKVLAQANRYFDLDLLLSGGPAPEPKIDEGMFKAILTLLGEGEGQKNAATNELIRFPQLPCMRAGLDQGFLALKSLLFPFGGPADPVQAIKDAWKLYPEALLPLTASVLLPEPGPDDPNQRRAFLTTQSELCQMAAGSPSVLPKVRRIARFFAIQQQYELHQVDSDVAARQACLENIEKACNSPETSANECAIYFRLAMRLRDFDLARQLLSRWRHSDPRGSELTRAGVDLESATGAYGSALALLDQFLAAHPDDRWAASRRQTLVEQLRRLAVELDSRRPAPSSPR